MKDDKEKEILQKIKDKEDRLLLSKILDLYHSYQKKKQSTASGFLNITEQKMIERALQYLKVSYQIFKVNNACEKSLIYFGKYENFVSFYCIHSSSMKHSDVLGTLFRNGFTPSMIGDIFISSEGVYLTNLKKYDFILETIDRIGRQSVKFEKISTFPTLSRNFQNIYLTVSSTRVDLILSKLIQTSRKNAKAYKIKNQILVNYKPTADIYLLKEEDILSIEGIGKFIIKEIQTVKSSKQKVWIQKYC